MASRVRKVDLSLALVAFGVSFGITLTAAILVSYHGAEAGHAPARPPGAVLVQTGPADVLSPAALDRQWIVYSDRSTCADRAGGDGASAIRISSLQVAWFFSDSSLGPAGPQIGLSRQSGFVHNLVVMQTIRGGHSRLVTVTGGSACAGPAAPGHARSVVSPGVAGGPADQRYWAGDGLRIGSRVLRFYTRYLPGALVPVGTVIAEFAVRQLARDGQGPAFGAVIRPRITTVPAYVPPGGGTPIVWGAAVLRRGATVYVYGWQKPGPESLTLNCYLARVAASSLTDVSAWRFYAGSGQWAVGQQSAQPIVPGAGVSVDTGFSVIEAAGRYWLIEQAGGLGSPDIDAYPGAAPWGPFKAAAAIVLYRAPGIGLTAADRYQIMYEARAEPALSTGRTLMISYNVNSLAVTAGCLPLSAFTNTVIQPRFIAVPRAVFGASSRPARPAVAAAGLAGYPPAGGRHRPRWFDTWDYRGGCPPLRAVRHISVSRTRDRIRVRWQNSGPGVRYQIFLHTPSGNYILIRTASTPSVTLSDLIQGGRYHVLIVPVNARHRTGPGTAVAVRGP